MVQVLKIILACSKFDNLDTKIDPVFPLERCITIKEHSVRRRRMPMCPAFSPTDYTVQDSTLTAAVLDLEDNSSAKGQDGHKKYWSIYVQLSRLQSLDGLHILQSIDMEDLRFRPDDRLLIEIERHKANERKTIAAWVDQMILDLELCYHDNCMTTSSCCNRLVLIRRSSRAKNYLYHMICFALRLSQRVSGPRRA